jgi:leucyl-tRNA synthetase
MRDMGLVKFGEPVARLLTQGMINKETYACPEHEWLFPEQVTDQKTCSICGREVITGRVEKMSKSKKNAVDPIEMINIHGADALRLFVLFAGPPEKDKEWSDTGVEGAARYLQRVWRIGHKWQRRIVASNGSSSAREDPRDYQRQLRRRTHQLVKAITENFEERLHLNTCISSLMELTNEIYTFDQAVEKNAGASELDVQVAREALSALIPMLAPFAPHIAEELWESFGHSESLTHAEWPSFSEELAREEEIEVAVQVNGKLRTRIFAQADATDDRLREAALADDKVKAATAGRDIAKVIVIPRKLVNIVIK